MRHFSDGAKLVLTKDAISTFFLVAWDLGEMILRHTTFPYDLLVPDLSVYPFIAENGLVSIDAPRLSNTLDREVYKLAYLDETLSMLSLIGYGGGGVGTTCTVYIGFINTTSSPINGALPGSPMVALEDLVIAYEGILDTYGFILSADDELVSTFECSSPLAALDMVKPIYTSPNNVPDNDHCYDQVHVASAGTTIHWGRIA